MTTELRYLVVGYGGVSRGMCRTLEDTSWAGPVAVADVSEEALAAAAGDLSLPAESLFTDLGEALDTCDANAALINTPSELHDEQSKAALEAGLHVLVAKPITNDFQQAVELVDLAAAKGLTLSVGQQIRYNRHYTAVREFVEAGRLGSVEAAWFMNSKPRPKVANLGQMAQPALCENACHHFDSFLAVFGDDRQPEWISCDGFVPSWSAYAGPCMANALIRFSGGLHVSYHGGFSSQSTMYEFRLEGTGGALCCHGLHMSNDEMRYEFAPALGKFEPIEIDTHIPARNPWMGLFDAWRDYVAGGPEPPFSGRNNLKAFAMLSAAIESAETNSTVEIAGNPKYVRAFEEERP